VAVPRLLHRNLMLVGLLLSLLLLAVCGPAEARPLRLAWNYEQAAPSPHTGFVLRGCRPAGEECVLQDLRQLGARQRQVQVQVPPGEVRCFVVYATAGKVMTVVSDPSNMVCVSNE
jgi:hypothetical protein